ncbi:MAG: PKD domain-containing protein [Cytophagales bacterium]|nr:PKD domain-containing protein [Cytophagales bacterium]
MKNKMLTSIVWLAPILSFGQGLSPSQLFLKVLPDIDAATPEWAIQMYGENPNVWQVDMTYEQYYLEHEFEKNIHTQNYKHWRREVEPYITDDGHINVAETNLSFPAERRRQTQIRQTGSTNEWKCIGPIETFNLGTEGNFPVSWQANVYSIAVAKSDPDILYCGTESGGIFKTTDKGLNWSPVSHDFPINGGLEGISIHPANPDIVYVIDNPVGVFKTSDGGNTWLQILAVQNIGGTDILIHGSDPDVVFVASAKGLYKSIDGGSNWNHVFTDRCWDLESKPNDPNTIYLAKTNPAQKKCELFKSTDGGNSWILKTNGWYNSTDPARKDIGARIATTMADPETVYVGLIGESKKKDDGWIGVYQSQDAGESWINRRDGGDGGPYTQERYNLASINKLGGYHQGFFNFDIEVSSIDPNKIWVGTVKLNESTDGGATWKIIGSYGTQRLSWIHPDIQDLEVIGNEIWVASDGGVNFSNTELMSHESRKKGITASDFWGFGSGWNEDVLVGGRYHNGNTGYYQTYNPGEHLRLGGAEAPTGYVNPGINRKVYFSDIKGKIIPEAFTGNVQTFSVERFPNQSYAVGHSGEMEFDPRYFNHVYIGQDNKLWKSTDAGISYSVLKTFGTNANDKILHIEIARSNPDVMYCAQRPATWSAGTIWKTTDGGINWVALTPPDTQAHFSRNMFLQVSPLDENVLWVGLRYGPAGKKIYKSTDGGVSWENLTTPALNVGPCHYILHQAGTDGGIYYATDRKIFYRNNSMPDWVEYADGLPAFTPTNIMKPFYKRGKIRTATYGRGIWENDFYEASDLIVQPMTGIDKIYCARDTVPFEDLSIVRHDGTSWQWEFPGAAYVSSNTVRNPKVLYANGGTYDVSLTVTTTDGLSASKTISGMITVENLCDPQPVPGYALQCVESGDYVQTSSFDKTVSHLTISAWIKPNGEQKAWSSIAMNDGNSAGFNFTYHGNNTLGYHWPNGAWWWDSGLEVPADKWSYVAAVFTPDSVTLYLNGESSVHKVNLVPVTLEGIKVGSYKGWGGRNYNGEVDEVSFWDRALSQKEIREMRHITKERLIDPVSPVYDPSLFAYYQFNETIGLVMDMVGTTHGSLAGNSFVTLSSAPIGGGVSQLMTLANKKNFNFKNVGVKMQYKTPPTTGDVVVTRMNLLPVSLPPQNPSLNSYWVINNYGDSTLAHIKKLKFKPEFSSDSDDDWDDLDELSVILFQRSENEHLNNWSEVCRTSGDDDDDDDEEEEDDDDEEEYFVFEKNCGISSLGQFMIFSDGENQLLITSTLSRNRQLEKTTATEMLPVHRMAFYPNPVKTGSALKFIYEGNEKLRLRIYSNGGKLVADRLVVPGPGEIGVEGLKGGLYFYSVQGETFIKNGKILIQQ